MIFKVFFRKRVKFCSCSNLIFRDLVFDFFVSSDCFLCSKDGKLFYRKLEFNFQFFQRNRNLTYSSIFPHVQQKVPMINCSRNTKSLKGIILKFES